MQESAQSRTVVDVFGGYNHNDRIGSGEFYDMKNLSSDHYPLLHPRKPRRAEYTHRRAEILGIAVMGGDLWFVDHGSSTNLHKWDGEDTTSYDIGLKNTKERRRIVPFGAYLIILPDKVYINTADVTDFGGMDANYMTDAGDPVSFSVCDMDGNALTVTVSDTAPESPSDGQIWMKTLDPYHTEYYKYSSQNTTWLPFRAYLKISSMMQNFETNETIYISDLFRQGDTVHLHMNLHLDKYVFDQDKTYKIVTVGSGFIVIPTENVRIQSASEEFSDAQLVCKRSIPNVQFLFEHDNRLWGCSWYEDAQSHKIINEIRASKLGDFRNWDCFEGLASDSYVISCGSDGAWTGAAEVGGYPCFFKEKYLHKVYGDMPSNYSCDPVEITGVQEGCQDSLAVINGVLYYKARNGICKYDGSLPVCISPQLGNIGYLGAVGGGFGEKYYVSMLDDADHSALFVYDIRKRMWHKEDDFRAEQFCSSKDALYCLQYGGGITSGSHIYALAGGSGDDSERISDMEWFAETGIIGEEHDGHKYYPKITVRMNAAPGARVKFFADYDSSGRWTQIASVVGKNLRSFSFPIRPRRCDHMRLRIEGKGDAAIHSVTYITEKGSVER